MNEGKLSVRQGGRDNQVHRCTCGAWSYTGIACSTCATLRGQQDGLEQRTTD